MDQNWRERRRQERWARRQERWGQGGPYGGKPLGGVIFGLILIGGGLLFLLRNLGIVYFENIGQYWPVILIVIGGTKLVNSRGSHEVTSGLILTGVGTVFLLRNLGILYGNVWGYLWPMAFIAVGLHLLVRNSYGSDWWNGGSGGANTAPDSSENRLVADVVVGGIERKIVSQVFEGGKISVVFGGANIDLRGAAFQTPEITLLADAVFGGVDLKVPESWQVEMRGSGVFGGYEDRTHHPTPSATGVAPKLIVKGGAVFGGVTVRN